MPFDPTASTASLASASAASTDQVVFGVAAPPKPVMPVALGDTSIVMYTFGPGPMGFQLDDAQGGTRVIIGEVVEGSEADRMGLPVGGVLMKVANRTATNKRRAEVGKWVAAAERPLVLQIMHPGGAAAAAHGGAGRCA